MYNTTRETQLSDTDKQLETAKKTYSYLTEKKVVKYVLIGGAAILTLYSLRYVFDAAAATTISFKRLRRAWKA